MIKEAIARWIDGQDLNEEEALACMQEIMGGVATPAQIGGALVALRMKGETASEVAGMVRGMRAAMTVVDAGGREVVDTCGTGGDGAKTFNISTAAAFAAAGAGVCVAKHGNRSVSSLCGSADVFAALGIATNPGPEKVTELLRDVGLAFLFAPVFHPAMKHAIGPRREMGVRTVFNMLGPLCNPALARRQVVGVFSPAAQRLMASALAKLDTVRALIVHGSDGLDEITLAGPTAVIEVNRGVCREWTIEPAALGLATASAADLAGGDAAANAALLEELLANRITDARLDVVLLNTAAVLVVADVAGDLPTGLERARESIVSGKALAVLQEMRKRTPAEA